MERRLFHTTWVNMAYKISTRVAYIITIAFACFSLSLSLFFYLPLSFVVFFCFKTSYQLISTAVLSLITLKRSSIDIPIHLYGAGHVQGSVAGTEGWRLALTALDPSRPQARTTCQRSSHRSAAGIGGERLPLPTLHPSIEVC